MYKEKIKDIEESLCSDIAKLVSFPSVQDLENKSDKAPFGPEIRKCMDAFLSIATNLGFRVHDEEGYAVTASIGHSEEYIGVLGHLDVVEAGDLSEWQTSPFEMTIKDGMMYGRGVNDDKGPLLGALYAAKLVHDLNPNHKEIRIIAGGAEETTWDCVHYYFQHHKQPQYAFSPDGNFPLVNGEMGIYQVKLVFNETCSDIIQSSPLINYVCHDLKVNDTTIKGDKLLSRNPHKGENAIFKAIDQDVFNDFKQTQCFAFLKDVLYQDVYGKKTKLYHNDPQMSSTTVCVMSLNTLEDAIELNLDVRYPKNTSKQVLETQLKHYSTSYGFAMQDIRSMAPLFVPETSPLIQDLLWAYEKVMHQRAQPITKAGASYARSLDCGVAFGATFESEDPRPHMANECMPVASLLKAIEIYAYSLQRLACD